MANIFGQVSKLIVIFILTLIISGSILTYLSITNISNYRELLEKKISEEEGTIAKLFTSEFQNKLDDLNVKLGDYLKNDTLGVLQNSKYLDSIDGIVNYVKIDNKGSYIIPNFTHTQPSSPTSIPSKLYSDRLHAAENSEFIAKDFKRAELSYLKALNIAATKYDSAHIYNSIARLYVKMNLPQKAFEAYQIIITKFSNTLNSSGFPYSYFSIIKLLEISNPANSEQLQNLVLLFMNGMDEGSIPLNYSSSELLDSILEWPWAFQDSLNNKLFNKLINNNRNSLRLINNYGRPIDQLLSVKNNQISQDLTEDFSIIKPVSGDTEELMMFFRRKLYYAGFVIGLSQLFMDVLHNYQKPDLKFEYEINLVENTKTNQVLNTTSIMLSDFSPHFEDNLIQVSLKDRDIIDRSVLKRKVTYGIGLFLILGTMILGLYLLIKDANREKRMRKLRNDFISSVTHELKTPLTSIHMFAEALNMGKVKSVSNQKKYSNIIINESEKLKRLMNNILEFSKKENDKLTYKLESSNLTDIVNSTIKEMNYFIEINEIDLHLNIENNIVANVHPEGIKQALSNLISNAIKYSSSNKRLNINLFNSKSEIFIEVEDFGVGIAPEELELIFEKFYRINSIENKTASGTGLGLTVTKDIIEGQNGKLAVESTLGKGSKFTIVLNVS